MQLNAQYETIQFQYSHVFPFSYQVGGRAIDINSKYTLTFDLVLLEIYIATGVSLDELNDINNGENNTELPTVPPPELPNVSNESNPFSVIFPMNISVMIIVIIITFGVVIAFIIMFKKRRSKN